jgi:hypothetical protein
MQGLYQKMAKIAGGACNRYAKNGKPPYTGISRRFSSSVS